MKLMRSFAFTAVVVGVSFIGLSRSSRADSRGGPSGGVAQICSLGSLDVGQPGTLICKDALSGAPTQSILLGRTVSAAGGIAASLVSRDHRVLVTNQADGAILFRLADGRLHDPVVLQTDGEGSLSGALGDHGAYVLTGTTLRFFPNGHTSAASARKLLLADGSAATVTLTNRFAYVSEKKGSLQAFRLGYDGRLSSDATPVAGVSPGAIVGITGLDDLVVAPVAHLASNFNQAEISVGAGLTQVQRIATKEVAACWASNDGDDEVCVTNPGSMTVSCGRATRDGLLSYTSAAASLPGESVFDLDMSQGLVGMQGVHGGQPVLVTLRRTSGDFLLPFGEVPVGTTLAAGALLLPPLGR